MNPTALRLPFPTRGDEERIWVPGRLRLFVSHASKIETSGALIKEALERYGIGAFVAHEEIEPSASWAREIGLALRSMHAFCAIVTPDFHSSPWCDQEVGFALGRPVPVLAVKSGAEPYGLLGHVQAIAGADDADVVAQRIFDVLVNLESCRPLVIEGLVSAVENARAEGVARQVASRLKELRTHLSREQMVRVGNAVRKGAASG